MVGGTATAGSHGSAATQLERERELAALTSLFTAAAGGDGGAAIVSGPAGA
jgi:hypothetical protein